MAGDKNRKKRKKIIISLLALATLAAGFFFAVHFSLADLNFSGFGWIGNDLVSGVNTGEPAIGWLSFSSSQTKPSCGGSAYAVSLGGNQGDSTRPVMGYAWFGIGSTPDSYKANLSDLDCPGDEGETLGWVNFQAGAPSFCSGRDCHPARWNDADSDPANGFAGYMDGWAKIVSMGDNGWVRLRGKTIDGHDYGLSLDEFGVATGDSYGWNSGGSDGSVADNSGLGWIKFSKAEICSIYFLSPTRTIYETVNELSLHRNRAAGFPVTVNLSSSNPSRLSFPTNPLVFPKDTMDTPVPISITDVPDTMCTDNVRATAQSICGQSSVDLTILQNCSLKCSPGEATIMPGETVKFTANVQGYSDPSINWSYSGSDSDCVDLTRTSCSTGDTCTIGIYINTPGGKFCAMKSFQVTARSSCDSCGSGVCELFVSRPGWIETSP